jgi:ribosomal protein S18 acetylase RimI-like enzyme
MENISLQRATLNDLETFLTIERSLSGSKTYSAADTEEEAREELTASQVYFIKFNNEVAGSIQYQIKNPDKVYLSGLVIKPEFQGKGIARGALEIVLEKFKTVKQIYLVTHPENTKAIKLYESLGFMVGEKIENYFGDGEPRIVLTKQN